MGAERHEVGKVEGRFRVAGADRIQKELRAILGHLRGSVADDEPLAELGHRLDVTTLRRDRELVDRITMPTCRIVLRGNCYSANHHNLVRLARRESRFEA
jgi:hypothetical protein